MLEEINKLDRFMYETIQNENGKILDFGCGEGRFVNYCLSQSLDIIGADTYEGIYEDWSHKSPFILKIEKNIVPVTSGIFDVIISNQVFEHIPNDDVPKVSKELTRLLKFGGYAYHIFPTRFTLIEPHVGIFGAHWLISFPKIQRIYLEFCFILGFGYWRSVQKRGRETSKSSKQWAKEGTEVLKKHCHYVSYRNWREAFEVNGTTVQDVSFKLLFHSAPSGSHLFLIKLSRFKLLRILMNAIVTLRLGKVMHLNFEK